MDFFELKVRKKSYKIKLKRKLSPSTIWYSIICFKVVKKKELFFKAACMNNKKKYMLRRLRYAAVALKTQMPDQKR